MTIVNQNSKALSGFDWMPPEIKFQIFESLLPEMIKSLSLVCKDWKAIMSDDETWKRIAKKIGLVEPFSTIENEGPGGIKGAVFARIKSINERLHFSSKSAKSMVCKLPSLLLGFPQTVRNIFADCTDRNGLSLAKVIKCTKSEKSIVRMAIEEGAQKDSTDKTILQAIKSNDLELVKTVLKASKPDITFRCIKAAFVTGDMAIIQEIEKATPNQSFSKLWENTTLSPHAIGEQKSGLFNAAANSGNIVILKYAEKLGAVSNHSSFNYGVKSGNIEMVDHLLRQSLTANKYSFNEALATGHLEMVLFLIETLGRGPDDLSFESAIQSGSQGMVNWFKKTYPKFVICTEESMSRIIHYGDPKALQLAIRNMTFFTFSGLQAMQKWIFPFDTAFNKICIAMNRVDAGADPALLRLVLNDNKSAVYLDTESVLPHAIHRLRNADITKILIKEGYTANGVHASEFIRLNDLELFKMAAKEGFMISGSVQSDGALNTAISTGNLELLNYIFAYRKSARKYWDPAPQTSANAFDIALQTGNVDIINFVADKVKAKPTADSFDLAMRSAVQNKKPDILTKAIEGGAKPGPNTQAIIDELGKNQDFSFIEKMVSKPSYRA